MSDARGLLEDIQLVWGLFGISAAGLTAAFVAGLWFGRLPIPGLKRETARLQRLLRRLEEQVEKLRKQLQGGQEELGGAIAPPPPLPPPSREHDDSVQVWLQRALSSEDAAALNQRPQMPILLVANLKGGVGKTMLTANLGCYFATRASYPNTNTLQSKRVLLADLDYQGSLTDMILRAFAEPFQGGASEVRSLFSLDRPSLPIRGQDNLSRLSLLCSEYHFESFETRVQFAWLSAEGSDIRLSLLRKFQGEEFRDQDLVIIDTGPRLSAGNVSALVAASHLLVPSALDNRSQQATERFLSRVGEFKSRGLCPHLKVLGVLPTLRSGQDDADAINGLRGRVGEVAALYPDLFVGGLEPVFLAELPRRPTIQTQAEGTIPYLVTGQTRTIFNAIGAEVERRMIHEGGGSG